MSSWIYDEVLPGDHALQQRSDIRLANEVANQKRELDMLRKQLGQAEGENLGYGSLMWIGLFIVAAYIFWEK